MDINPPVDATKTPEWAALQKHYDELQSEGISLKQWFADVPLLLKALIASGRKALYSFSANKPALIGVIASSFS